MSQRVLHITDFHVNNPLNGDEHLCASAAPEYLKSLVNAVNGEAGGPVHCIVATGDFVDKGKTENFPHAQTVLETLVEMLHVPMGSVSVCIGNHDFDRTLDEAGEAAGARTEYTKFAAAMANGKSLQQSPRAVICRPTENIFCLMLDATLGCGGKDMPGRLEPLEVDQIMDWVRHDIPRDGLLAVGSHYPVFESPDTLLSIADNEPRYQERHLWNSAKLLRHRLAEWRQGDGQTVWLCGDIHAVDQFMSRDVLTLTTGRLGTRVGGSAARKQARVIQFDGSGRTPRLWTLNYEPLGHTEQAHYGKWMAVETDIRVISLPTRPPILALPEVLVPPSSNAPVPAAGSGIAVAPGPVGMIQGSDTRPRGHAPPPTIHVSPLRVETIDDALERKIMEVIASDRLYTLGRFNTSETTASLSWVSIGPLLEAPGILTGIIDAMADWLRLQSDAKTLASLEDILLVGIDCWGAVLASQLGVLTGATNYCVASRGGGRHHTASEMVNEDAIAAAKEASAIVLVTDVVSTGQSLSSVCTRITSGLGTDAEQKRWIALSILCDSRRQLATCQFLHLHATTCGQLRMPILSKDDLPDEEVLPPTLSFISA